jgi:hypothetical protein
VLHAAFAMHVAVRDFFFACGADIEDFDREVE